jgi:hypothetical protein
MRDLVTLKLVKIKDVSNTGGDKMPEQWPAIAPMRVVYQGVLILELLTHVRTVHLVIILIADLVVRYLRTIQGFRSKMSRRCGP